ncbi:hypothetical protein [Deinococcus metallilatus]|uniref:Excinuclease UvrABC ATPase subunit n=1 Tax=Deinococcus metallilatus TaxID=1211322 RepID=A0ABR6MY24_9DEIO|nr:hypothetical protein [Deinococcus metallilatus]MBB5296849.1 excinuclease UvrABC ATPase subunit [Deinococcus metallilatus]GMA13881.1 hypothetical protein GCM10025871_02120 [Deinococcus metallilatus]
MRLVMGVAGSGKSSVRRDVVTLAVTAANPPADLARRAPDALGVAYA